MDRNSYIHARRSITHSSLQQQLFSSTWDLYTDLRQPYIKHNTVLTLLDTRRSFLQYLPDRPLGEYTDIDLLQFTRACVAAGRRPGGVNIDLRNLRAFGHWLGKKKVLDRDNVFAEVEVLPVEAKQIRFLSHEEFRKIYQAESSELLRRIYLVCLLTGQRIGDVLALDWADIDFQRAMIRSRHQKPNRLQSLPINPTSTAYCEPDPSRSTNRTINSVSSVPPTASHEYGGHL